MENPKSVEWELLMARRQRLGQVLEEMLVSPPELGGALFWAVARRMRRLAARAAEIGRRRNERLSRASSAVAMGLVNSCTALVPVDGRAA